MRYQEYFKDDMWLPHPQLKGAKVDSRLASYPDLTEYAVPVNCIKARYYLVNGDEKVGLNLLWSAKDANPNIGLRNDLLAEYYAAKKNYDSSFPYAQKAIAAMPRCRLYVKVFLFNCLAKKDSNSIQNYFTDLIAHSTKFYLAGDWEKYCATYYQCTGNSSKVLKLLDSALAVCPGNQRLLALQHRVVEETEINKNHLNSDSLVIYQGILNEAKKNYSVSNYKAAILCFKKAAALAPTDYSNFENLGLICFQEKDFAQSIIYLKKVIDAGKSQNGKPEYYCALSLYNLRNWTGACKYATSAAEKKYEGAEQLKRECCKQ
jgi:tetratricopeptide (TPR) repeat protein